jgi:hypothetical protein
MVSPDSAGTACPLSGRNSTYRPVQISATGSNHVCYELRHGGGDNLPKVFEHEINERKIVCGIVDSDKRYPLATNAKLTALLSIVQALAWPLGFALSPPCREAENVIPFGLVMSLPSGYKNSTNALLLQINRAEAMSRQAIQDYYWFFFDLKEGLNAEKFRKYSEEERRWIEAKLSLGGVNPYDQNLSGYGDKVIRQLREENRFLSELKRLTRQTSWRQMFSPFIDDLVWPLAASVKVIT